MDGAPRVARDVEQRASRVVVVADEVEVRAVGTRHAIATSGKPARIETNRAAKKADRRAVARRQDHLVERLLGSIVESGATGGKRLHAAAQANLPRAECALPAPVQSAEPSGTACARGGGMHARSAQAPDDRS